LKAHLACFEGATISTRPVLAVKVAPLRAAHADLTAPSSQSRQALRVFAVTLVSVACHGEAVEARRAEAGRIAEAVRVLRVAAPEEKRPLLKSLGEIRCSAEDLCALRKSCQDAYALELSATDGIAAVRHAVREPDPVPTEAAALLAQSEGELRRAVDLTKACADSEAETRRRYSF
jgi:hypothetical protein